MARTLDTAKKTAILKAARSILVRDGYAAAKMSDIATEAGVAQGTLYLYFENKEALASSIGEEFFARLITQFGALIQKIEDPDGIIDLVEWALIVADQDRVVLAMAKERNAGFKSKVEIRNRLITEIGDALSALMTRGVIRHYPESRPLAELVMALMRRLLMSYAVFEDENTDELKEATVTLLQHALFDDVTIAASRLLRRKQQRDLNG